MDAVKKFFADLRDSVVAHWNALSPDDQKFVMALFTGFVMGVATVWALS